jgi:hypothetical protein
MVQRLGLGFGLIWLGLVKMLTQGNQRGME